MAGLVLIAISVIVAVFGYFLAPDLYEILLVDDFSTDGTAAVALQASLPNLMVIQPEANAAVSSKKKAIEATAKCSEKRRIT